MKPLKERIINQILFPEDSSEFEVQAEMYDRIKRMGLKVRGCVRAWVEDFGEHKVFFDLVVFDDKLKAIAIIECKNSPSRCELGEDCRQKRRYSKFQVPLLICSNLNDIERVANLVKDLL